MGYIQSRCESASKGRNIKLHATFRIIKGRRIQLRVYKGIGTCCFDGSGKGLPVILIIEVCLQGVRVHDDLVLFARFVLCDVEHDVRDLVLCKTIKIGWDGQEQSEFGKR